MAKAKTVAWKSLKHARGPATRVPDQIADLVSPKGITEGDSAYGVLWDTLVSRGPDGQGAWFDASAPAALLLLDSVSKAADPTLLFVLTGDILGGDQLRGWLAPADAPLAAEEKAAHDAAVERKDVLLGGLSHKEGTVRGAAAMALAMVPELAKESVPALTKAANTDADDIGRAGALLALGRLGGADAAAKKAIDAARGEGSPALVRGAAGVAWLREDASHPFEKAHPELSQWLGFVPPGGAVLPWFKAPQWYRTLFFPDAPARALAGLGRSRGKAGVAALADSVVALSAANDGAVESQLAKIALDLGGFSPDVAPTALAEELSPDQKAMAEKLARTSLLPVGGYRLPASGAVRRRWIGADPPGPLDRKVPSAEGPPAPLWRVLQKRPAEAGDFASPLERWQSIVEFATGSYPPFVRAPKPDELEGEIAALPRDEETLSRAAHVVDDIAERRAAIDRTGMVAPLYLPTSRLLLQPFLQAGRPLPAKWDRLVYIGKEPQSRDLLQAIPEDRRENALCEYMRGGLPATRWARGEGSIGLLDLAPTRKVGDTFRWLLTDLASRPGGEAPAAGLRTRFDEIVKKHPSLGA